MDTEDPEKERARESCLLPISLLSQYCEGGIIHSISKRKM